MLAHAGSLLRAGHEVHLVGTARTPLPSSLQDDARLHVHPLHDGGAGRGQGMAGAIATGVRGLRLGWRLAGTLFRNTPRPDLILVQTPPPIPTLPVAMLAAHLRGAKLVVDWHNLGWTLLALRFGPGHLLVRATRFAELWFGGRADAHVAVSQALAHRLGALGMGDVVVLHDGPSSVRPFSPARGDLPEDPLVVVAPMGWTRDDDLPLLAAALQRLSEHLEADPWREGNLRLLVSGNGPLRREWGERLRALGSGRIQVETPDVPVEEYPALLAAAHLGISIHRSSSGLDLPMKIVELHAVGVPVLALEDGSPLEEIAPPGSGVLCYRNADELAELLWTMLTEGGGEEGGLLRRLTTEVRHRPRMSWDEHWRVAMDPLLRTTE